MAVAAPLLALALPAMPAQAQDQGSRRGTISVTGSGEAQLKPDFARILVSVGTQADTIAQAVDANRTALALTTNDAERRLLGARLHRHPLSDGS